jgi:hypothetical protein
MTAMQQLVGKVIEGLYPRANYRGIRQRLERRRLYVDRVRVLDHEPLDPLTLKLDPLLDRCGVLVSGQDLDRGEPRSFYLGAMKDLQIMDVEFVATDKRWWRVDIVCESRGTREPGERSLTYRDAQKVAEWFGTEEDLHAEIVGPLVSADSWSVSRSA